MNHSMAEIISVANSFALLNVTITLKSWDLRCLCAVELMAVERMSKIETQTDHIASFFYLWCFWHQSHNEWSLFACVGLHFPTGAQQTQQNTKSDPTSRWSTAELVCEWALNQTLIPRASLYHEWCDDLSPTIRHMVNKTMGTNNALVLVMLSYT